MDLDDELRRILSDDRLDVALQPGAEERIVAGARRRRARRRAAVTGTVGGLAIAGLVAGAVLFTDPQPHDAMPPAENTTTTRPTSESSGTSTAPSATATSVVESPGNTGGRPNPGGDSTVEDSHDPPPPATGMQIGPTGFGVLYLGMSLDEAKAVNGTVGDPPPTDGGCGQYPLLLDGEPAGDLHFSSTGLEAIVPTPDVHTAEGVSKGWTVAQVKEVYPSINEEDLEFIGRQLVEVPGNPSAVYRLQFADGVLTGISLQSASQSCFE